MKKIFTSVIFSILSLIFLYSQQTVNIDLNSVSSNFTLKFADNAINVAACTSKIANPKLYFQNPFKDGNFKKAVISFDVYNYGDLKHLGALISVFSSSIGRMYFSNYAYLGFNVGEQAWFDANLGENYTSGVNFLSQNTWKKVKLVFTPSEYAVYVDNELAFNNNSTNVRIAGPLTQKFDTVMYFLKNADIVAIGTGSWWSDNQDPNGNYWDIQNSYIKNLSFYIDSKSGGDSLLSIKKISEIDVKLLSNLEDSTLVLDVAKLASKRDNPLLAFSNPFKGKSFDTAEIYFDVYNYDTLKVLGALFSIYKYNANPRLYFTNGSYLGFNDWAGGWFDANLKNYGIDKDFLGMNFWRKVKIVFTSSSYKVYVDNNLAFDNTSTDVTINGSLTNNFDALLNFLKNIADTMAFGTGSFWSDNQRLDGTYYDVQFSYLKNISFVYKTNVTSIKPEIIVTDNKQEQLMKVEYYDLNGVNCGNEYNRLRAGFYIKKEFYKDGSTKTIKIFKSLDY